MGYIAFRNQEGSQSYDEKAFAGINRKEKTSVGEFTDMKNMSSEEYPYISTRKSREPSEIFNKIYINDELKQIIGVRAVAAPRGDMTNPAGFCGVIDTTFYYNGKPKSMKTEAEYDENGTFLYGMEIAPDGEIQLIWANRILIIHGYNSAERKPYIYYYDTDDENTNDDYVKSREYEAQGNFAENTMSFRTDGTGDMSISYKVPAGTFTGGYFNFKVGDSVFIDEVMTYSDSRWSKFATSEITSAVVTEYSETRNSTSEGYEYWDIKIVLKFFNSKGEQPFNYSHSRKIKHIYKKIPYMSYITLHKGRLWGANPNGEYVYASSFEDLMDFVNFENLSSDSAFLESSTHGGYIGTISCGEALFALKADEIEAIYGELPNEFAVGKRWKDCGCRDILSCCVIDNILYFLGDSGFYMMNGSKPQLISEKLNKKYKNAFAFSDGVRYYVSACDFDDKYENLVFDTRYGIWDKEDENKISGFFRFDGKCFILSENVIYEICTGTEKISWYAESIRYFFDEIDLKRINELWIKAKTGKNSEMRIYSSCKKGKWNFNAGFISDDEEYKTFRVPVRAEEGEFFRYRIEGDGECCIMEVRFIGDVGGKDYRQKLMI